MNQCEGQNGTQNSKFEHFIRLTLRHRRFNIFTLWRRTSGWIWPLKTIATWPTWSKLEILLNQPNIQVTSLLSLFLSLTSEYGNMSMKRVKLSVVQSSPQWICLQSWTFRWRRWLLSFHISTVWISEGEKKLVLPAQILYQRPMSALWLLTIGRAVIGCVLPASQLP